MPAWKKYALLQLPGLLVGAIVLIALVKWVGLPLWAAAGLFALWVMKDIALYPLVRTTYESEVETGAERLVGEKGIAQEWLCPRGMVRVRGEIWKAQTESPEQRIEPSSEIKITGARGMTLIVSKSN
ncbi:MAG TPA: NfeD family protein [Methylomirabilota bacterium]|nr:NfeD family protein [Methylomirabilota bacterium]